MPTVTDTDLKEMRSKVAQAFKEAKEYVAELGKDDYNDLTEEERTIFDERMEDAKKLDAEYAKAAHGTTQMETLQERYNFYHQVATGKGMNWNIIHKDARPDTLGKEFTDSDVYKELLDSRMLDNDQVRITTKRLSKAATDIISTVEGEPAAALMTPDFLAGILGLSQRELTVRELFSQGTTRADVLSYARQVGFDNAAGVVAQATTTTGTNAAGGLKPQSSIAWDRETAEVHTIATYMVATRKALRDPGFVRGLIDNQGRLMIRIAEEDQLLSGAGGGTEIEGILNVPTVLTLNLTGVDNLDGIRVGIKQIRTGVSRATPDAIILNPEDSMEFDLLKDIPTGAYRGGNPIGNFNFNQTIWRLRRVESEAIPEGTALIGAFKMGATVYQQQPLTVYVTDSHSDFFVRNLIAILFEEALALPVFFPTAFNKVTLAAWGTSWPT